MPISKDIFFKPGSYRCTLHSSRTYLYGPGYYADEAVAAV